MSRNGLDLHLQPSIFAYVYLGVEVCSTPGVTSNVEPAPKSFWCSDGKAAAEDGILGIKIKTDLRKLRMIMLLFLIRLNNAI